MLTLEDLRTYCLDKKAAKEDFPFGPGALVIKVATRMFALISIDEEPIRINLKCNPVLAGMLRNKYPSVLPGYHMNKEHWNTVIIDGTIPEKEIRFMIDHSYEEVVKKLSQKVKEEIMQ